VLKAAGGDVTTRLSALESADDATTRIAIAR